MEEFDIFHQDIDVGGLVCVLHDSLKCGIVMSTSWPLSLHLNGEKCQWEGKTTHGTTMETLFEVQHSLW